jgi:tetratricopeptide (TPR) repeat protein
MNGSLYDRNKEALRAGHLAVIHKRLDEALAAYREAAEVAPDRALPRTSIGGVFLELGRPEEALVEFDAALGVAPADERALLGRAEALIRLDRPVEAAESLDALADIQDAAGRYADAVDTIQRALVLEERTGRRRHYQRAVRSLRMTAGDRAPVGDHPVALRTLERATAPAVVGSSGRPVPEAGAVPGQGAGPEPEPAAPSEPPAPPDPVAEGERIVGEAVAALDAGDRDAAAEAFQRAAAVYADAGLTYAALDACREGLSLARESIDLHLRYVSLYRSRGWRDLAIVKLTHLLRLADLDGDAEARARIVADAREAFPGDEEVAALIA